MYFSDLFSCLQSWALLVSFKFRVPIGWEDMTLPLALQFLGVWLQTQTTDHSLSEKKYGKTVSKNKEKFIHSVSKCIVIRKQTSFHVCATFSPNS